MSNFKTYTDTYLKIKKSELKQLSYEKYVNLAETKILPYFKDMNIEDIKVSNVRLWFTNHSDKSPKTRRNYLMILRGIFKEAFYDELITKNPVDYIKVPQLIKPEIKTFEVEEIILILENAKVPYKNFFAVLFFTAMRPGEALSLKIDNIDLHKKVIHIKTSRRKGIETAPKTQSSIRTIPIFPELIPYLEAQLKITKKHKTYLFLTPSLTPYKDYQPITYKYWKKLLTKLDIPYRKCYQSRHTMATFLLNSNQFTKNQVAQILGHNSTEMLFRHYAGYLNSDMQNINKDFKILLD